MPIHRQSRAPSSQTRVRRQPARRLSDAHFHPSNTNNFALSLKKTHVDKRSKGKSFCLFAWGVSTANPVTCSVWPGLPTSHAWHSPSTILTCEHPPKVQSDKQRGGVTSYMLCCYVISLQNKDNCNQLHGKTVSLNYTLITISYKKGWVLMIFFFFFRCFGFLVHRLGTNTVLHQVWYYCDASDWFSSPVKFGIATSCHSPASWIVSLRFDCRVQKVDSFKILKSNQNVISCI